MLDTIHLVPSFHYDIEYLLPLGAYMEISLANLLEAHRLLKKHPRYTFRVEQVYLLDTFLREYPSLVEDMRRFAAEGRLEVSSGMYSMADINMSGGEAILRNLLVGKRWCREQLGIEPTVLDMGDCIGHPASMPQITATTGYDYFLFFRAVDSRERNSEIRWEGIDGTVIPTYWLSLVGYAGWHQFPGGDDQQLLASIQEHLENHHAGPAAILPHGGDFKFPYERGIASVEQWNKEHPTKFLYSTYRQGLDAVDFSHAPLETREWNPSHQGCYSSRIRIKRNNRRCEAMLHTVEVFSAWAEKHFQAPADHDGLARAWNMTFLNQFHDTLWGTISDTSYREALQRAKRVEMICRDMIEDRLGLLVDKNSDTRRVAVFNPLAWDRTAAISVALEQNVSDAKVFDDQNKEIPSRKIGNQLHWTAKLPASGLGVFRIDPVKSKSLLPGAARPKTPAKAFSVESIEQENGMGIAVRTPLYDATFAPGGTIRSLKTRTDGVEFIDPKRPAFSALCYQTDRGDLWHYYDGPHSDGAPLGAEQEIMDDPYPRERRQLNRTGKRYFLDVLDNRNGPRAKFDVQDLSEDRLVITITSAIARRFPNLPGFYNEEIRIDTTLTVTFHADDPQIDFSLETHHVAGKWYRLRAAFFTDIDGGTILHEIPFGRYERPEGEFPAQNYIAYYNDEKGVVLLNKGLPGNNVTDGVMMLSLMRSVNIHTRAQSDEAFEIGQKHRFDYAVIPFSGKTKLDDLAPARRGMEFNIPPAVVDSANVREKDRSRFPEKTPAAPASESLLKIDPPNIVCSAMIPQPDGSLVVRLIETAGESTNGVVTLPSGVTKLEQTNALLESSETLPCEGSTVPLAFRPFEIKTLRATWK
ncbi:MAG: hypothetical protein JXA11_11050 [Phycisphaerae bacterium]|nr:hypothetical protein [Phycisphaerae bacterium]